MFKNNVSPKEIERRAYRSTFEDGIYDIQFGLLFLLLLLGSSLEAIELSPYIGLCLIMIPLIFPWLAKRYITIPRMGEVEFGPERKKKKRVILIVGAVVLFFTLPLLILMGGDVLGSVLGWKLLIVFAAPLFVLAVYTTDFPRLYLYAALMLFSVVNAEFLLGPLGSPLNAILSFGLPGLIITAIGINLLIKFIRTYPKTRADYVA